MSYDIFLKDRVTGSTIQLSVNHIMTGGTYKADYDPETGTFSPAATSEAWLNITYNYAHYYYEAAENDYRFYGKEDNSGEEENLGIRGIYGKTGIETIQMLQDLANRIEAKYKRDGNWITTIRRETIYRNESGKEVHPVELLVNKQPYIKEESDIEINEGDCSDYWRDTAANAIRPLYQLITMAQLRPDGVWDGD